MGMDEVFKQNLLRLRQPPKATTFAQALFGEVGWAVSSPQSIADTPVSREKFSEKAQILESLERYAQEKLGEDKQIAIKIPGGEIALRPEPAWSGISRYGSLNDLKKDLSIDDQTFDLCLREKELGKVRIMFVPESFRPKEDFLGELREGFINQLLPSFSPKTADLFSRMLLAMKLEESEVIIYPTMMGDKDISQEVMQVAGFFSPEIIVTLGANPTHKILKGQERLAEVHGQFFYRKIENMGTFTVVPLFHPSIIENNQNMKKTAWSDMQKIMKHLKKI